MPSKNDTEALYAQVQRKLVESGEWDRIQLILMNKLNESGWTDDLRHRSKENARDMEPLSFRVLLKGLAPHIQTSIPPAIRKEMMAVIRQYVEKQFE
ncbi:hypothetical protein PILCRDRAFT_261961 [Piloderma croceum F 1598]|uniref:Transcription and mRNA export factor SUS1 n=1 Tax=Piloderma croceum (strain F 1598) TaxID=765440 RepID=A0A0C3CDM2_PILCF|nr:hypothetical protein PILCRDRAFT_261961 [Piloderma croceum F 1598]